MPKKSGVRDLESEKWLSRIKYGEKLRQEADDRFGYSRSFKEYRGDYASVMPSFMADTAVVPINEVFGYVKAFIPSVYSRNPHVAFNAKGADSVASSKLLELAVNAYWRELRLKRQVRRCIFDAIMAEGWFKTGYSAAFGSIEPEDGDTPLESNEYIRDEEIFATRISWKHMVRDCDAVDGIHDARWVAQKIIKPLQAVVDSPLYTAKNINATAVYDPGGDSKKTGEEKEEFIEFYEVWDMDSQKVRWVSEGCTEDLREPKDWPYRFNGYPFDLLRFNDNSDEMYAPNLICPWEPQLWEKIKIRSMQMDHIKRFNRQLWAKKGSVSKAEIQKFALGKTGGINFYEGDMQPQPSQYPQVQTDIYAIENRIDQDKDSISGQPNVVRSAPQKTQSRTLGELQTMVAGFQARQVDPQGEVEDFCAEIAYKLAAIAQDYLSGEKLVRVTRKDLPAVIAAFGNERWDGTSFKFNKKDVSGAEFETEVAVGSTLPLDRQGRVEAMVNILKLGASIGIQQNGKVSQVIGKNILAEFEMKEIELAYDEAIAQFAKDKMVAEVALRAKQGLMQQKIDNARGQILRGGVPASPGIEGAVDTGGAGNGL